MENTLKKEVNSLLKALLADFPSIFCQISKDRPLYPSGSHQKNEKVGKDTNRINCEKLCLSQNYLSHAKSQKACFNFNPLVVWL